jgi:hypothetical protein
MTRHAVLLTTVLIAGCAGSTGWRPALAPTQISRQPASTTRVSSSMAKLNGRRLHVVKGPNGGHIASPIWAGSTDVGADGSANLLSTLTPPTGGRIREVESLLATPLRLKKHALPFVDGIEIPTAPSVDG